MIRETERESQEKVKSTGLNKLGYKRMPALDAKKLMLMVSDAKCAQTVLKWSAKIELRALTQQIK
jgi:hypothetical protein